MDELTTPRLRLAPLTAAELRLYLGAPQRLDDALGVRVSRALLDDRVRRAIILKLGRMAVAEPGQHEWLTYWLAVVRSASFGAGLLGFKGPPDDDGEVEIGYGIDPAYRGAGYATEGARALIDWAFSHPDCTAVAARGVLRTNIASQGVLARLGMSLESQTAETLDYRVRRPGLSPEMKRPRRGP